MYEGTIVPIPSPGVVKLYRRLRLIDLILALTVHLPL